MVRASFWFGEQTDPQDRDRGVGEEALDRPLALRGDGGGASGRRAEDGSAAPLGRPAGFRELFAEELGRRRDRRSWRTGSGAGGLLCRLVLFEH